MEPDSSASGLPDPCRASNLTTSDDVIASDIGTAFLLDLQFRLRSCILAP